ncbi:MAG: HAMP domain-containing histidine kinase [Tannerella sp.]|nr:HAMP domain-containing histidine kinase [Tannerella sp.]
MEKRIRTVWLLSLVSAILVIGVQGYWLYNQYSYVADTFSEELAETILAAGEKEFEIRRTRVKTTYKYIISQQTEYGNTDSVMRQPAQLIRFSLNVPDTLSPVIMKFDWDASVSGEALQAGVDRVITEQINPFRRELADSILAADLPGLQYTITPWRRGDSAHYVSHWAREGRLFRPQIAVYYAYNPIEKEGIVIRAAVPVRPVFRRMAVQWALAFGLILLLTGCFVFQIMTILKQKKISELRAHFVNTMIHELKRPVQTLKTFVSFLGDREMRSSDENATEQVVQDAMFELNNLSAYLNKLKDMLRADSEVTALNRMRFDLPALIGKVIRLTPVPAGKTVRFSVACEMGESGFADADPVHVANVLNNLVENAVKYSGESVDINVKASRTVKGIHLTVSDNGAGIPAAEHEKVFAKFYRGAGLPGKDIPGMGLGLSYVKLIAQAHHGDVTLNSRPGKGTSVTLFIPQ